MNSIQKNKIKIKPKKTLSQEANKVILNLVITLGIFILALSTLLVINSSKSSQNGYILKQAQIENDKLRTTNEELKTKIVKMKSFEEVTKKVSDMETPETKEYVIP